MAKEIEITATLWATTAQQALNAAD